MKRNVVKEWFRHNLAYDFSVFNISSSQISELELSKDNEENSLEKYFSSPRQAEISADVVKRIFQSYAGKTLPFALAVQSKGVRKGYGDWLSCLQNFYFCQKKDVLDFTRIIYNKRLSWWKLYSRYPTNFYVEHTTTKTRNSECPPFAIFYKSAWGGIYAVERFELSERNLSGEKVACLTSSTSAEAAMIWFLSDGVAQTLLGESFGAHSFTALEHHVSPFKVSLFCILDASYTSPTYPNFDSIDAVKNAHVKVDYPQLSDEEKMLQVAEFVAQKLMNHNISWFNLINHNDKEAAEAKDFVKIDEKFRMCDIIGIPYNIIINQNSLKFGIVELRNRNTNIQEKVHMLEIAPYLSRILQTYRF